jgi:hypothetical protein
MLKWVSTAVGLSLIAALVWAHRDPRSIECTQWPIAPRVNSVLPMEKPDNGERPGLEVVARVLRRLLFATCILLGLAFAVVCYAEMLGVVQFD